MIKIVSYHCAFKAVHRLERDSRAVRLWSEEYFSSLILDKFGIDAQVLSRERKPKKVFHTWKEG